MDRRMSIVAPSLVRARTRDKWDKVGAAPCEDKLAGPS